MQNIETLKISVIKILTEECYGNIYVLNVNHNL